ncbi:MAG: HEAT repeat domain-containing protein [Ignavibacteriaceae bacterium]|jgi:energy-coupling factor transporter ATP-binding protein EcfA2|nr:HEAT repeat domain-containing protein [Ignavibacteriaceae bacterium]
MTKEKTYIQYGVPSSWAHEYEQLGISTTTFKQTSKKNLIDKYKICRTQINFVKECLVRKPINEDILQTLLERNNFICCLCKGTKSNSYIIHHIEEYSKSQDNSYDNLAVLCPNDHDEAHKQGKSLTSKVSAKQIRKAKKKWEEQVIKENKEKAILKSTREKTNDWKKINPYKELQAYAESDKEYFFGRKGEIEELLTKIYKYNIVGLFGESGTGKTSLVNAGLIPNFKDEGFITVSVRCLDEPIRRIREELLKTLKEKKISAQLIEELATTDNFPHLIIQLKSIVDKENINLIVVIDQFEELFTRAREAEREHLSKGITEALAISSIKGKIYFLLSLREDYIGELWDWAHLYNLENAWIQQYRIKRLNGERAFEVIVEPLKKLGIKVDDKFIFQLILELKSIGDDLIYPPYLQIVCSKLFDEYKVQNSTSKPSIEFGYNLYSGADCAESIIADYLSESMLEGLTDEEKLYAQNILDLLTGPEGLRTFLNIEEISRYLITTKPNAKHVIEHLIKKKIVHPVIENGNAIGYELVHDFLSKKFFDNLGPEAQRAKTTIDIFRKAFREWKQHGVFASKDRLEILFPHIEKLILNDEEWTFLIKSSFTVPWWYTDNKLLKSIKEEKLIRICTNLIEDENEEIVKNSIRTLGSFKDKKSTLIFKGIIESPSKSVAIRETAIDQFWFNIIDKRILDTLKNIISNEKESKLRKASVYAFAQNLSKLSKSDDTIINREIVFLYKALDDPKTEVRRQVADVMHYILVNKKSVEPLIDRLKKESSISSRKAMVMALGSLIRENEGVELISPILERISSDESEDYRVREQAKLGLRKQ